MFIMFGGVFGGVGIVIVLVSQQVRPPSHIPTLVRKGMVWMVATTQDNLRLNPTSTHMTMTLCKVLILLRLYRAYASLLRTAIC